MTVFPITSISNASLSKFPNNTCTQFVHKFPAPIDLNPFESHSICLKSIAIHLKFESASNGYEKSGYIKVHLKELNPQAASLATESQCLARIPLPSSQAHEDLNSEDTYWYEIDNPVPISLNIGSVLDQLSFTITDADNNILPLTTGPPTILNLTVQEMKYEDRFSIAANPQYSVSTFSDNSNSDFHVKFPSPIELGDNWEVALHSIVIPKGLGLEEGFHITHESAWGIESKHAWTVANHTFSSVVKETNIFFKPLGLKLTTNNKGLTSLRITSDEIHPHKVTFNDPLCRALGISSQGKGRTWSLVKKKTFVTSTSTRLKTKRKVNNLAIYCDLVTESVMGNAMCPLMEVVPCKQAGFLSPAVESFYAMPHLTFRPLKKHTFTSMQILLYTLDGKPAPFVNNSQQPVGVTLTFMFRKHPNIE